MRHILFLIPSLRGGGAERVIVTLLRNLDRSRFRLTLAVIDMTDAVFRDDVPADVEVIDLKSRRVRGGIPKIVALIWRLRPDLVFSTLGYLNLALAILRTLLPNKTRYIARESTVVSQLPGSYAMPRWWFWAYRRFYSRLDVVVCQSLEMQDDLVKQFGVRRERTVVINNPVDVERIRSLATLPPEGPAAIDGGAVIRLIAAGSLSPVKGFDVLLEALARCRGSFHLTILGEGPLLGDLQRLVVERGLSEHVRFLGFKRNPYAYFSRSDALVLSSRFEGFPNVVLEALACGTPVVATPSVGGVREILQRVEGCVLASDCTAGALAQALDALRPGQRIPAAAVEPYSLVRIIARYEQLFLKECAA